MRKCPRLKAQAETAVRETYRIVGEVQITHDDYTVADILRTLYRTLFIQLTSMTKTV